MSKRIALVQCINPQHNDSTPSMAVYDQGKDKLQVHCFGCQYHAWVSPTEIDFTPTKDKRVNQTTISTPVNHTELVTTFFTDRNFNHNGIPWGYITMGNEQLILNDIQCKPRPYMEWSLNNQRMQVVGMQRRYLDDRSPKTKYLPVNDQYAEIAWINKGQSNTSLHIAESWVDAMWVYSKHAINSIDILTILGTNPGKIKELIYDWANRYNKIVLWFDGDEPGIKCAKQISNWCLIYQVDVVTIMTKGKKVYEYERIGDTNDRFI